MASPQRVHAMRETSDGALNTGTGLGSSAALFFLSAPPLSIASKTEADVRSPS